MRYLYACWLLVGPAALAGSAGPTLQEARQRWLHGNYEEARALYETLAADARLKVPATLGLSRAWQSQGAYDKALAVVEAALADHAASPELHARRAEVLYLRGRWQEAERAADRAVARNPEQFLARWVRAQIYWDRADLKRADTELRWFVRTYTERSNKDDDIKDPEQLLLVGLAGAENARWHNLSDQFRVILTDVYGDALKYDKDFWPAEYQAGRLLLEKYNRGEALDAFDKALAINPNAALALVGKGLAALQRYEVHEAEQLAARALRINPKLPEALCLAADVHLLTGEIHAAAQYLDQARRISPRDERILGRSAACLLLQGDPKGFETLSREVLRHDPKPGVYYFQLARQLEERKRYPAAEEYYQKAIALRPMLPEARNELGLLYMRLGQESKARDTLTRAFQADEFNVRVANSLKVLRHLENYQTLTTDHFLLRYDPRTDRLLARYLAPYLEEIYTDLASKFGYRPPGPILIELFNNHEMFSGRVTALPDLPTYGASTGRLVALVSPYARGLGKPFNWARVLRHELVHVFNLEQTAFQVPHWFTEGLAVMNEGFPRPQTWNELLRRRVPAGDLLNLDTIDLAFIRPRSPLDWTMAYCQGQLYVEYLRAKYGPKAVGELLDAYGKGLDTAAAIARVCLVDKATFEKGYRAYLEEVVKGLQGRPPEKAMTYRQLQEAHEREPANLDVAARLAEQYLVRREKKEARKLAEEILARNSTQPLASYVKARLLLDAGDDDQARTVLEAAVNRDAPEPKVLRALGELYFTARDFTRAAHVYELGRRVEPSDSAWLVKLLRVYTQAGDRAKQIAVLKELVPTDADDLDQRKRLAQMLFDTGDYEGAAQYARQALEIDVRDAEVREILEKALERQGKTQELEKVRALLEKK